MPKSKIKIFINGIQATYVVDSVKWQGEKSTVSRTLNFSVLYEISQADQNPIKIQVGDRVEMFEEESCLFLGYVEKLSYSADTKLFNLTCVDLMKRLLISKCVGRFQGTLTELCDKICGMFNLKNEISTDNPHIHNIVSEGDLSFYDILNIACSTAFNNFTLRLNGASLTLASDEIKGVFKNGVNIRNAKYSQEMTDMITQVLVIDNEGKIINTIQNESGIGSFGILQNVYKYDSDSKDNLPEAQKVLCGIKNSATIVCDNDNSCISGSYIKVNEPNSNLCGIFEIVSDSHIIGGDSQMTLSIRLVRMEND